MKKLLLLLILFVTACCPGCGFEVVSTGHRGIKTTFGKVNQESLPEGIYFYNPLSSSIHELDVREFKIEDITDAYTKDLQQVKINTTVNLYPQPESMHLIYANVGQDWIVKLVPQVVQGKIKEVIGHYEAVDIVSKRHAATAEIETAIREELKDKYVIVKAFEITNTNFNDAFEHAIEAKVVAVQQAQEAQNRTIKIQEEANQRIITAKAEAESMRIRANALSQNKNLVEYEAVQKWDGKLPQYSLGSATPFISVGGK